MRDFIEVLYFFKLNAVENDFTMICFYYTYKFIVLSFIENDLFSGVFRAIEMKNINFRGSLVSDFYLKFSAKFMVDVDDLC